MNTKKFKDLLEEALKEKSELKLSLSDHKELSSLALSFTDEDLTKHVLPELVNTIIKDKGDKKIKEIKESTKKRLFDKGIKPLPNPEKKFFVDKEHPLYAKLRRYDRLARLIAPKDSITPCVALTFFNGKLIISTNTPKDLSVDELTTFITKKLQRINEFLEILDDDIERYKNDDLQIKEKKICFSTDAIEKHCKKALEKLMDKDHGGYSESVMFNSKETEKLTPKESLEKALLKIGAAYLYGRYGDHERGFTEEELDALTNLDVLFLVPKMKSYLTEELKLLEKQCDTKKLIEYHHKEKEKTKIIYLSPNVEQCCKEEICDIETKNLHAEQVLYYYLHDKLDLYLKDNQLCIGISKLCCATCAQVLREAGKIIVRGTHGEVFPNVVNIFELKEINIQLTSKSGSLNPYDSDSDVDRQIKVDKKDIKGGINFQPLDFYKNTLEPKVSFFLLTNSIPAPDLQISVKNSEQTLTKI